MILVLSLICTLVSSNYPKALHSHYAGNNLKLVLNDVGKEIRQCDHIVTLVGKIELPAVPRVLAKRVINGNRFD